MTANLAAAAPQVGDAAALIRLSAPLRAHAFASQSRDPVPITAILRLLLWRAGRI